MSSADLCAAMPSLFAQPGKETPVLRDRESGKLLPMVEDFDAIFCWIASQPSANRVDAILDLVEKKLGISTSAARLGISKALFTKKNLSQWPCQRTQQDQQPQQPQQLQPQQLLPGPWAENVEVDIKPATALSAESNLMSH